MKLDVREGPRAGLEPNRGAGFVGLADDSERRNGLAVTILLLVQLAVTVDGQDQLLGKRVHDRYADPVQTAGNLVGVVVELTARVQDRHDHLGRRAPLFGVNVHRNAAAVVGDRDRLVRMYRDRNCRTVARQGLVDGVIDHLENHVVQARAIIGIADVHSGALAHRLKAL